MPGEPRASKGPKRLPELTVEQKRISDDFMRRRLEVLPRQSAIELFNHGCRMVAEWLKVLPPRRTNHGTILPEITAGKDDDMSIDAIALLPALGPLRGEVMERGWELVETSSGATGISKAFA